MMGTIFQIQPYSIHDGPGIRTTVFVKGCPLRCLWCHNAESQSPKPQLMVHASLCKGCGSCVAVCGKKAISLKKGIKNDIAQNDWASCDNCGRCVQVCRYRAREMKGYVISAEEAFSRAAQDRLFFDSSGGGVTISGGEPLMQPEFTKAFLMAARKEGIHTAVETCGFAGRETALEVLSYADLVLYDLKAMDRDIHKKLCGVDNVAILENLRALFWQRSSKICIRMPVIPNYNDSREGVEMAARFIQKELDSSVRVHLLPYHSWGNEKYEKLGEGERKLDSFVPSDMYMKELCRLFSDYGVQAQVGGSM